MKLSITKEKAAKPPHPTAAAWGPFFACKAAPVMHPLATEFQTSCLPRYFSTKHSDPPKTPVMKAKLRHQYKLFSPVARNTTRICSRKGACGTSLPAITVTGGVASDIAPRNTPMSSPITPPPTTPMAAFPPHEELIQEKSGGSSRGVALRAQGWKYGKDRLVMFSKLVCESSLTGTGRCSAISCEYNRDERGCCVINIS